MYNVTESYIGNQKRILKDEILITDCGAVYAPDGVVDHE
jgi:hypothetical protein